MILSNAGSMHFGVYGFSEIVDPCPLMVLPNSNFDVIVNAPYFDGWRIESEERMVFIGGHPAKY